MKLFIYETLNADHPLRLALVLENSILKSLDEEFDRYLQRRRASLKPVGTAVASFDYRAR